MDNKKIEEITNIINYLLNEFSNCKSEECDIIFRNKLKESLKELGYSNIDILIEKYGYLWRDKMMLKTFHNIFDGAVISSVDSIMDEHLEKWLLMRNIQYYFSHLKYREYYDQELNKISKLTIKDILLIEERLSFLEQYRINNLHQLLIKKYKKED